MGFLELFPQMDETSPLAGQDASNGPKSYTDTTTQPLLPSSDFKLYKRRWAMLALFSIISMLSGALQFTTSAIQDELVAWYKYVFVAHTWLAILNTSAAVSNRYRGAHMPKSHGNDHESMAQIIIHLSGFIG
jgi:hypothetical protein